MSRSWAWPSLGWAGALEDGGGEEEWGPGEACCPSSPFTHWLVLAPVAALMPSVPNASPPWLPPQDLVWDGRALHRAPGCALGAAPVLKGGRVSVCSARGPHRAAGAAKLGLSDGAGTAPVMSSCLWLHSDGVMRLRQLVAGPGPSWD